MNNIQIADVIGFYIGCKMIFPKSGRITTLQGVDVKPNGELWLKESNDWKLHEYFPFKLLLKRMDADSIFRPASVYLLVKDGYDVFGLIEEGMAVERELKAA